MKKTMLMLAAVAMIAFTACKDEGKASKEMTDNNNQEMAESAGDQSSDNTADKKSEKYPVLTFDENPHDFGTVENGSQLEHVFTFTNTGDAPLKVMKAKPSCGCTVPEWSKDAIAPGEKGSMTVKFDARGRAGKQHKNVRLTTNTEKGNEVLAFSATIE